MSLYVIGLTGAAGSGKSTVAQMLVANHGAIRLPFAKLLKDMLVHLLEAQGIGLAVALRMVGGDLKEVPSPHLGGRTPRYAMQTLGTEWGRALVPTFWVDAWRAAVDRADLEAAADMSDVLIVADDVRFPEEVAAIRALGGLVVRITRPGAGLTGAAGAHSSETTDLGEADTTITNDGSLDWLLAQADALACNVME